MKIVLDLEQIQFGYAAPLLTVLSKQKKAKCLIFYFCSIMRKRVCETTAELTNLEKRTRQDLKQIFEF